jgi:hypothetical protein
MAIINIISEVQPHIDDALLVAWDGCHKIYLALDETEAKFFRDEYPHVVEGDHNEKLAAVSRWWDESCGLRFVSGVRHNAVDPNAGFTDIVPQFAEDDECDEDDEDEDTFGECDECGAEYDAASRFDHDADAGLCWDCAGRDLDTMTTTELDAYLAG